MTKGRSPPARPPFQPLPPYLVRVFVEEAAEQREPHDFQVEPHRPVLNVVEVVFDALLERRVAAPAIDLRPAGQSSFYLVPQHVLRETVPELLDEVRTLRPRTHNRHIAAEHVPELREFVDVRPPQEPAERGHTGIVWHRPYRSAILLGIVVHRSELDDREGLAVEAHAFLAVENGTLRRHPDQDGHDAEWNGEREQRDRRNGH